MIKDSNGGAGSKRPSKPAPEGRGPTPQGTGPIRSLLIRLGKLGLTDLRQEWSRRWPDAVPPIRTADALFRMIAWRLQCEHFGGPDRTLERRLADLDRRLTEGKDLNTTGSRNGIQAQACPPYAVRA